MACTAKASAWNDDGLYGVALETAFAQSRITHGTYVALLVAVPQQRMQSRHAVGSGGIRGLQRNGLTFLAYGEHIERGARHASAVVAVHRGIAYSGAERKAMPMS